MGRRQGSQASRGRDAINAVAARSRRDRVTFDGDVGSTLTNKEVPFYCVGKVNTKYGVLCARRSVMKAKMSLKDGVTGFGCVAGCHASITYPLSEKENELLMSMGCSKAEDVEGAAADVVA